MGGSAYALCQVTDLNRGDVVFANDRALVASGALNYDNDAFLTNETDLYPDNFGKGSDDGRFVVNDQLYLVAESTAVGQDQTINVTVRVNASIVSLTAKDFMAIAIQSTAADN
jgi:Ser-tRNA(Ala) deacylase AlaX